MKPVYRLRDLIKDKYGEKKFLQGCNYVAQWLAVSAQSRYKQYDIANLCALMDEKNVGLTPIEKEALRQLFGLRSIEALYTSLEYKEAPVKVPETEETCTPNFVI